MVRKSFMLIAGETSGDLLAAELVHCLGDQLTTIEAKPTPERQPLHASLVPEFFGAGGPHMAQAGVKLAFDMTEHAVVGLWEVLRKYREFKRLFHRLFHLAVQREPLAIICVDFSGFNLRFAHAIRRYVRSLRGTFGNWRPWIIQYVSPQVWASRPERARRLEQDVDLLLSVFPFEKEWYARRTPRLRVEYVGHPIVDRYAHIAGNRTLTGSTNGAVIGAPSIVLLPGSRKGELTRHLPVITAAMERIWATRPDAVARMVLPNPAVRTMAQDLGVPRRIELQVGDLGAALSQADLAIASTGTVTLECAYFGVPTVSLYRTSWSTYWIGKQLIQVKFLAMPNILAGEELYPEFIQTAASPGNIARAALELLDNPTRLQSVRTKLRHLIAELGPPGAAARASKAILELVESKPRPLRAFLAS